MQIIGKNMAVQIISNNMAMQIRHCSVSIASEEISDCGSENKNRLSLSNVRYTIAKISAI